MYLCLRQNRLGLLFANKIMHSIQSKCKRDLLKNIKKFTEPPGGLGGPEVRNSAQKHLSLLQGGPCHRCCGARHSSPCCRCYHGAPGPPCLPHSEIGCFSCHTAKRQIPCGACFLICFSSLFKTEVSCRCISLWNMSHTSA